MHVELRDGYFWAGETKIPPLAGEFHFWRNDRLYWPRIMAAIRDLGFQHLATYIHWDYHRLSPPRTPLGAIEYDFTGETSPQRDLAGFLDRVDASDFWLNIRPGPYIYAETEFEGVPGFLYQYHRNHPTFLAQARDYIAAVCEVIVPHLVTRGGRVFLCQVDNEVSMIKHQEQVLEAPVDEDASFRAFLREKYGDLAGVQEAYGASYDTWDDVEPVVVPEHRRQFCTFLDMAEYLEWYDTLYIARVARMYRENGIDVPLYINSTGYPFPHDPNKLAGHVDLLTTDLYYRTTDTLVNMVAFNAKYLRAITPLVFSGEFRSGGRGFNVDAGEYLFQALLWMAYGFHGVNYFMLVERQRWPNTPIDYEGRPMDPKIYRTFQKICRAYSRVDFPEFTTTRIARTALLWYRAHAFTNKAAPVEPVFWINVEHANNQVFRTLLHANVAFDLWYPASPRAPSPLEEYATLIFAGHDFFPREYAETVRAYLEQGGVVFFPYAYPVKTKKGAPLDTFADVLTPPRAVQRHGGGAVVLHDHTMLSVDTPFFADYDLTELPGATPYFYKHMNVGYSVPVGRGTAHVLGFDLSGENWRALLELHDVGQPVQVAPGHLLATVQRRHEELLVTVVNPGETRANARINLNSNALNVPGDGWRARELLSNKQVKVKTRSRIALTLPARGGCLLHLTRAK